MPNASSFTISNPDISTIVVLPSRTQVASAVAKVICDLVYRSPHASISYATGDTMIPIYHSLLKLATSRSIDFSRTLAFHLDEYFPCHPSTPYSFLGFLKRLVFKPLKLKMEHVNVINGLAGHGHREALRYNKILEKNGPVDLALLGIGPGGHIGFNEPGTVFDSQTHLVELSPETIRRDRVERSLNTPSQAITQGIGNIISSQRIILVLFGENKGIYLKRCLSDKPSIERPASALRLVGHKVSIFCDQEAGLKIT